MGRVFLASVKERERLMRQRQLDPRNASRSPSASSQPSLRLRYQSPINACEYDFNSSLFSHQSMLTSRSQVFAYFKFIIFLSIFLFLLMNDITNFDHYFNCLIIIGQIFFQLINFFFKDLLIFILLLYRFIYFFLIFSLNWVEDSIFFNIQCLYGDLVVYWILFYRLIDTKRVIIVLNNPTFQNITVTNLYHYYP